MLVGENLEARPVGSYFDSGGSWRPASVVMVHEVVDTTSGATTGLGFERTANTLSGRVVLPVDVIGNAVSALRGGVRRFVEGLSESSPIVTMSGSRLVGTLSDGTNLKVESGGLRGLNSGAVLKQEIPVRRGEGFAQFTTRDVFTHPRSYGDIRRGRVYDSWVIPFQQHEE